MNTHSYSRRAEPRYRLRAGSMSLFSISKKNISVSRILFADMLRHAMSDLWPLKTKELSESTFLFSVPRFPKEHYVSKGFQAFLVRETCR